MNQLAHAEPATPPPEVASSQEATSVVDYFARHLGEHARRLLNAIDGGQPTGQTMRGTPTLRAIEGARRSDDPTLPMGPWAVELKQADWPRASHLIVDALCTRSKDLRLAAWLLEAEMHQRGFTALAPCFALMHAMCERWWEGLHPQAQDGDHEPRANIVRWVNDKLLSTLSLIPLVQFDEHVASWSAWELAHHHERIRAANGALPEEAEEAASLEQLQALMAHVPVALLRTRHAEIAHARDAIATLEACLRERMQDDAPTLHRMDTLLGRMQSLLQSELNRRHEPLQAPATSERHESDEDGDEHVVAPTESTTPSRRSVTNASREQAYRELAGIADFLMQVEPHSPVPYLLYRAIAWGQLDAASLYHELFLKAGGQISIFELMGLAGDTDDEATGEGDS
ncbi:type VI secretion system protein TssA [Oleiagrimonas soli]|uniref:Type VI secretion system ImpA family protein n=1 Tax=Oleiagrimonas soli TaxID=1543381 RepID=A0A841KKR6_9GAMM|nr:type VI secretion system protein TssA [Oleiagrimonas soli]MBB6183251.1 type VI secretion system ImpA family protein [Oleiagrimonas soli]